MAHHSHFKNCKATHLLVNLTRSKFDKPHGNDKINKGKHDPQMIQRMFFNQKKFSIVSVYYWIKEET